MLVRQKSHSDKYLYMPYNIRSLHTMWRYSTMWLGAFHSATKKKKKIIMNKIPMLFWDHGAGAHTITHICTNSSHRFVMRNKKRHAMSSKFLHGYACATALIFIRIRSNNRTRYGQMVRHHCQRWKNRRNKLQQNKYNDLKEKKQYENEIELNKTQRWEGESGFRRLNLSRTEIVRVKCQGILWMHLRLVYISMDYKTDILPLRTASGSFIN